MDPTRLQPIGDRVLVKAIKEDQVTPGGVVLPESARDRPERARVIAVGPGRRGKDGEPIPMPFQPGDEILFHRLGGVHVGGLSDDFIVFNEKDILAKVHSGPWSALYDELAYLNEHWFELDDAEKRSRVQNALGLVTDPE